MGVYYMYKWQAIWVTEKGFLGFHVPTNNSPCSKHCPLSSEPEPMIVRKDWLNLGWTRQILMYCSDYIIGRSLSTSLPHFCFIYPHHIPCKIWTRYQSLFRLLNYYHCTQVIGQHGRSHHSWMFGLKHLIGTKYFVMIRRLEIINFGLVHLGSP